ncbi:MAG: glycosyltransferase family 4 protein [Saprospirales bacterium]|nr:glycosyltransferase family 4 protein [Saprospirales bacterium]
MKKVLSIVFNNFLHDSRVLKECISLKNAGYEVRVAALHSGELPEEEVVAGIPVTRIRLRTRHWSKNRLVQLIKYAELWVRLIRMARHADILHCNDLEPLPVVVLAKWLVNRRAKIVYDAHELEFDKSEAHTKYYPRFFLRLAERFFIRHANAMIVVSPLIADAYVERYGIPRPAVVMNCPNYHAPQPHADIFRKTFPIRPDQRIYLYQGGLIPHRGVEPLLEIFPNWMTPRYSSYWASGHSPPWWSNMRLTFRESTTTPPSPPPSSTAIPPVQTWDFAFTRAFPATTTSPSATRSFNISWRVSPYWPLTWQD